MFSGLPYLSFSSWISLFYTIKNLFLVLVTLITLSLGCRFPQPPQAITISKPPVFKPSKPSEIKSFDEAMAAIMTAFAEDHHFLVDPIQLLLYKNTASLAAYAHGWTTLPIDVTNRAAEVRGGKIHINLEKTKGWGWAQLTDLLAHEYGHVIEDSLGGSEPKTTHWFREGFADWVAARVLQSLGWQDYAVTLHRAKLELIHSQDLLSGLRALDFQWGYLSSQQKGHIRTYTLAFVAVDRLIETEGLTATLQYAKSGEFSASFHPWTILKPNLTAIEKI